MSQPRPEYTGYTPTEPQTSRRIVTCPRCRGRGHFHRTEAEAVVHPHSGEEIHPAAIVREPCRCCQGSGRMLAESVTTYRPYRPEEDTGPQA